MKIFIGGVMPSRRRNFEQTYPHVDFEFASDQEPRHKWMRAKRADIVIIDKGRTTHKIIDQLVAEGVHYQLADGNAEIHNIIEEMIGVEYRR